MDATEVDKSAFEKVIDAEGNFQFVARKLMEANCDLLTDKAGNQNSVKREIKLGKQAIKLNMAFHYNLREAKDIISKPGYAERKSLKDGCIGAVVGAIVFAPAIPLVRTIYRGLEDFIAGVF